MDNQYGVSIDDRVINLLNNYSSNEKLGMELLDLQDRLRAPELIVPVLGVQGIGKSTLLNAILEENILPNNADETTCVPVEIKYGDHEKNIVYFSDSKKEKEINLNEDLSIYVDNNYNPGNEKKVSHIVLERTHSLLEEGLILVDLPGVGSLTAENEKTTLRYIKKLFSAIFMIPTNPVIRKSEEAFIKTVWRDFNSALFVQNTFGENKRDIKESVDFNNRVLEKISEELNIGLADDIIVINAYDAVLGRINKDDNLVDRSGIRVLLKTLKEKVENRYEDENKMFNMRLGNSIERIIDRIKDLEENNKLTKGEVKEKLKDVERDEERYIDELEKAIEDINLVIAENQRVMDRFARDLGRKKKRLLRSEMGRLINEGLVDGDLLSEAFTTYQVQYSNDVSNELEDRIYEIQDELLNVITSLAEKLNIPEFNDINVSNFNKKEALKMERLMPSVAQVIAIFASPFNLIGTIFISAGVGFFSNKLKDNITEKRGAETKRQLAPHYEEFERQIVKMVNEAYFTYKNQVAELLDDHMEGEYRVYEEMKDNHIDQLKEELHLEYSDERLREDIEYLQDWKVKNLG